MEILKKILFVVLITPFAIVSFILRVIDAVALLAVAALASIYAKETFKNEIKNIIELQIDQLDDLYFDI